MSQDIATTSILKTTGYQEIILKQNASNSTNTINTINCNHNSKPGTLTFTHKPLT